MDDRPLMIDLFCCAGGAAMGYHRAGFRVVGFDKNPQPRYPFEFHRWDLVDSDGEIHLPPSFDTSKVVSGGGSPPCQSYTDLALRNGTVDKHPRLIAPTRRFFERLGVPYVIENVEGAESEMHSPVTLCGTQFPGLRVLRHRLFETNWGLTAPAEHPVHPLVYTVDKRKKHYGRLDQNTSFVTVTGGGNCSVKNAREAMGIDWMTKDELNEALPPAYTEFIGAQLMALVSQRRAA